MAVAEARAILPRLDAHEEDPEADVGALRQLAQWSERYSPIVGSEEELAPQSLLIDITGCAACFHGEDNLLQRAVREFSEAGWVPRIAIADSLGAAWALAHFGKAPCLTPAGEVAEALRDLPCAALRLPAKTLDDLAELGINCIGALLALPRSDLPARFGPLVLNRIDQALGRQPEIIVPSRTPEDIQASQSFEYPTDRWQLVKRAAELEYTALAITEHNSLAGIVRAHVAAKAVCLKLLIGAEITPEDALPVLLYAPDRRAYGRLARLITRGRRLAEKGDCLLHFHDLAEHAEGLLAVVLTPAGQDLEKHQPSLALYRDVFGDRCHLAAALCRGPDDDADLDRLVKCSRRTRLPLVATNDVHYHCPERRPLHDVVTAVRYGVTVAELGARRFPNAERHLKSPEEMAALFNRCPRAIADSLALAERCQFSLEELRYEYPEEICPPGISPAQHLADLAWTGARERYPSGVPDKVVAQIHHELQLIQELRYEAYFLTVWDLVKFARERGILCQGRGSAANSAVCYCLGVTSVDPDRTDLLFERFVSPERDEAPDIDVDFEHERREEVIQYIYSKYGRDRAGLVAEAIAYRPRSAVRDVGKALGLSLDCDDRLAKAIDHYGHERSLPERVQEVGLDPLSPEVAAWMKFVVELQGFPRHLSQHVGGFVITRGLLSELVPLENAAMSERTVIQWDKYDVEALGILKVDCLALGMLTAIHKTFDLLTKHDRVELSMATVPAEDPVVYDTICRADTVGVFQIESRAQMSMLPRLLPRCFYDLVVEVAIVRPGPIQGGMVHPYLRRRSGQEPVTYPSPAVEQVLAKTFGVPIFQEQVMRLAMVAAGFTAGEADELRRAMGAWKRRGVMDRFRDRLRDGMLARGIPVAFADQLYEQIKGFGEYGFPESHAASFALLTYVSAWLKHYFPAKSPAGQNVEGH
jgi:error-prone DNA polymerase